MSGVREMCRRARVRAGALARGLRRHPAPTAQDEQTIRALLHLAANTIHPAPDAVERIRTRIGGAPGQGGAAAKHDDLLGSETPMSIISKPASAVRAGDLITRHPDKGTKVRYLVTVPARPRGNGVVVDYTAPADEIKGLTPNDRAKGILFLAPGQPCEVENAPRAERSR